MIVCTVRTRCNSFSVLYCTVEPNITGELTFTTNNPDEGEHITASCEWTGSPMPEVTWYKDGSLLIEGELPPRIRITMTDKGNTFHSSMEINDVGLSDAGIYVCNVSNAVGFQVTFESLQVKGIYI